MKHIKVILFSACACLFASPSFAADCATGTTLNCGSFCKNEGKSCGDQNRGVCQTRMLHGSNQSTCECFSLVNQPPINVTIAPTATPVVINTDPILEMNEEDLRSQTGTGCDTGYTNCGAVCTGAGGECTTPGGYVGHCQTQYDGNGGTTCSCLKGAGYSSNLSDGLASIMPR